MGRRKKRRKPKKLITKWLLGIGSAGLIALCFFLYTERHIIFPPKIDIDKSRYPVYGIDVSVHNGDIDFDKVKDTGVSFVIIKSSEGRTYRDPKFETYIAKARKVGLKVGAYHFFRMNRDGVDQAHNFMKSVKGHKLDLPLVVDVEDDFNDIFVSRSDVLRRLKGLVVTLKAGGYSVMLYTNRNGYNKYVKNHFPNEYLWLSSFHSLETKETTGYGQVIQQYSHSGEVEGIDGDVDLDVYCGTKAEWDKWLEKF